jgi:hypothetical protein
MNSTVCIELSDDSAQTGRSDFTLTHSGNITLHVKKTIDSNIKTVGQTATADADIYPLRSLAKIYAFETTSNAGRKVMSNSIAWIATDRH